MVFEHGNSLPAGASEVHQTEGNQRVRRATEHNCGDPIQAYRKDPFCTEPRRIGYARVSTAGQQTDRQVMQLEDHCDALRVEYVSAIAADRPVFNELMEELCAGDTLVVLDLDRAFRSAIDAMFTAQKLRDRQIKLHVMSFPLDTTSETGELVFGILALFAQFERRIIARRTREGLEAARRRGVRLGRPARLDPETIRGAYEWIVETRLPCAYVAALLGVSRPTLQRGFHKLGLAYPLED